MKNVPTKLSVIAAFGVLLALPGCRTALWGEPGVGAGETGTVAAAPNASDEVWCYRSLGKPDCYARQQPGPQERLIAVDPPDLRPLQID